MHVYFHDTDLLDARRRVALAAALRLLGLRRLPADADTLARTLPRRRARVGERRPARRSRRGRDVESAACRPRSRALGSERALRPRRTSAPRASTCFRAGPLSGRAPGARDRVRSSCSTSSGSRSASTSRSCSASSSTASDRSSGACSGGRSAEWLSFLVPITVLVFLQAGPVRAARATAGPGAGGRLARARRADRARLRNRHRLRLHDERPDPDGRRHVRARDRRCCGRPTTRRRSRLMRLAGIRRRVVLVGEGESLARSTPRCAASRGGIPYEFVGAVVPGRRAPACRCSAPRSTT